ncbi:MAG: hypothetical protein K0R49_1233, partial [Burkholderiales bacterium]|nr:hypothetical protein [Burkholderiales bacterium]
VPYTGALLNFYKPLALQGIIVTSQSITDQLKGNNLFGVCNGIESASSSQVLCFLNKLAINSNPNLTTIFPKKGLTTNIGNFVVKGAASLGISSVQPYRIMYNTAGAPYQFGGEASNPETVSAAVLVPETTPGTPLPASKIKGVVLYFHGTILSKGGTPSDFDGDLTPGNSPQDVQINAFSAFGQDTMLAAIYASQGYVVVAPDYVGQGANYKVQHPYVVFPVTNAQSGLNALKAARAALAALGTTLPEMTKLYITSYSEGGAYALWASQLAQTSYADFLSSNGFSLRRAIGISGAYDLSGTTLHYEFANASNSLDPSVNVWNVSPGFIAPSGGILPGESAVIDGARAFAATNLAATKSALAGYFLTSLAYYNSSYAATSVLAPNYAAMSTCVDWNVVNSTGSYAGTLADKGMVTPQSTFTNCPLSLNVNELYNTSGISISDIINQSFAAATAASIGPDAFLTGGKTAKELLVSLIAGYTNNSVGSFIEPGILNDPVVTPFLNKQNIQSMPTNIPTDIIFLNYDSTVSNINSLEACGNLDQSAHFPGHQPDYMGGMKQVSPPGMVTCINLANNGDAADSLSELYTQVNTGLPIMLEHTQANPILQLIALDQITAHP